MDKKASNVISVNMADLVDRRYWVRKFRQASSSNTLDIMYNAAERKYNDNLAIIAAINFAVTQRENEIKQGRLLSK